MSSMELAQWSNGFVYLTMFVLTLAMVTFASSFAASRQIKTSRLVTVGGGVDLDDRAGDVDEEIPGRKAGTIGLALTWVAFALLAIAVVLRGIWAGRVPWGNMYEYSLTSALAILGVFLFFSLQRDVRWLGLFATIPALLTLGLAVTVLYTEAAQLVPALKSAWLIIHVSAAIVCGGAFTIAAGTAGLSLVRDRVSLPPQVPTTERLQTFTYRLLAFAFPLWTFAVIAGAIWAENAWGRYWGWDPKETWAFITWVIYAAYLHARSTAGWRGNRSSWIAILGWVSYLINYFGVNLFVNSLHSYAGV
jgi:cytochrome c-type biogenesis protein CcsB